MGASDQGCGERMTHYEITATGEWVKKSKPAEIVLAFDPGAERMGWAALGRDGKRFKDSVRCLGSGIFGLPREPNSSNGKTEFQVYRMSLLDFWIETMPELIERYEPTEIVSEIIPAVGGGAFVVATQSHLALCAITTAQVVAKQAGIPVHQIGATTIKKQIGGNGEATKVQVRNGVLALLPELEHRRKEWTKIFEVPDALGVGLTRMGYKAPRTIGRKQRKKEKELNGK